MHFLVNASSPKPLDYYNFKLYRCIGHMMLRVLGNFLRDLDPKRSRPNKVFVVNASTKPLDIATSNCRCIGHMM